MEFESRGCVGPVAKAAFYSRAAGHHEATPAAKRARSMVQDGPKATALPGGAMSSDSFDGFQRQEVVRLLLQGLTDLGYNAAAEALELESGIAREAPSVTEL